MTTNKYKEVEYDQKIYAKPKDIISEIQTLDAERLGLMKELLEISK